MTHVSSSTYENTNVHISLQDKGFHICPHGIQEDKNKCHQLEHIYRYGSWRIDTSLSNSHRKFPAYRTKI